jgi:hypothetical protein
MANSNKPPGFKSIHALMGEDEIIAPVLKRAELIAHLQKIYSDTIPTHLKAGSRIAAMEGSTLVIATANGAVAAVLKQMLPRLLEKFRENQKQEQEVTAIRVIVQPEALGPEAGQKRAPNRVSGAAPMPDSNLSALTQTLSESPLKETVRRIQQRRKRALTVAKKHSE